MSDLLRSATEKLQTHKGQWRQIAKAVPCSYAWVTAIGRGQYHSEPGYVRLMRLHEVIKQFDRRKKAVARAIRETAG